MCIRDSSGVGCRHRTHLDRGTWAADTGRAMTQENIEIVRRGNAAFNAGDYVGFAETLHPDVEFRDHAHAADVSEALKGAQALLSLLSEWRESFDEFRAEISEYIEAGDHVVCVTRWTGTGKASDAAVDVSQVDVYELRDGQIVQATLAYPDKATALQVLGLSEWENAEQRGLAEAAFGALNSGDLEAFLAPVSYTHLTLPTN